jgi:hypothetical protein
VINELGPVIKEVGKIAKLGKTTTESQLVIKIRE